MLIGQGSHTALFLAPWGSGLITHDIIRFLILHIMGDSTTWNPRCEKQHWLFKLLTWRSIKNNVSWKSSCKVCQLELNRGPTILGKYLYIFVLTVHNSINHNGALHGFYPSPISQSSLSELGLGWGSLKRDPTATLFRIRQGPDTRFWCNVLDSGNILCNQQWYDRNHAASTE